MLRFGHDACRAAQDALQKLLDSTLAQLESERRRNDQLHDRLSRMHGVGLDEHLRALNERVELGKLESARLREKLRRIAAGDLPADAPLDEDAVLEPDRGTATPVETFSPMAAEVPARPEKPSPSEVMDE